MLGLLQFQNIARGKVRFIHYGVFKLKLLLSEDATPTTAIRWLRNLVRDFGLGFHIDSSPEDYLLPSGTNVFTSTECESLNSSLSRLFAILGNELPYEICAAEASAMMAESVGMKPPLEYHDQDYLRQLLQTGTREELTAWLCWNNPNGIYTDDDLLTEGRSPLTLDQARKIMFEKICR